jgi:hypothetical protein
VANDPIVLLVLGFLLTSVLGGGLAYLFQQHEQRLSRPSNEQGASCPTHVRRILGSWGGLGSRAGVTNSLDARKQSMVIK